MRKLRLFMAACAIVFGVGTTVAQEDVTSQYLTNADLSSLEGWGYGDNGYNYTDWNPNMDVPVIEFYHTWNSNAGAAIGNSKDFHFTQTVTLPAGNYRIAVNAFYREGNGNGTNTKAYIFAGEQTQYVHGLTAAEQNEVVSSKSLAKVNSDMGAAAYLFSKGRFSNAFDFDVETETTLELGFRGYIDTYCSWCILGPVKLYKYSLEDYLVDYRARVAEAQALYDTPMNGAVLQELKDAVVDESTFSLVKQVTTQIQALTEKINAANASVAKYAEALNVLNAASALDAVAQDYYATSEAVAEIREAYDNRTLEEVTTEQKAAAQVVLAEAVKKQTTPGSVYTAAAPASWVGQTGSQTYAGRPERYETAMFIGDVMTQTITDVPNGEYELVIDAAASYTSGRGFDGKTGFDLTVVFANEQTTDIEVIDQGATSNFGPYTVNGYVYNGELKYGLKNIAEGGNWFVIALQSIVYKGETEEFTNYLANARSEYQAQYKAARRLLIVNNPMNKDVKAALEEALVDESELATPVELIAQSRILAECVIAANASIEKYVAIKSVLDAANELEQVAIDAYAAAEAIQELQAAYNARTLVELSAEQRTAAREALRLAAKLQKEAGADFTAAAATSWVGQTWTYNGRPERYNNYVYTGEVMSQTIDEIVNGEYELVIEAAASTTTERDNITGANTGEGLTVLFANDETVGIDVVSQIATDDFGPYTIKAFVTDGVLKFGLENIAEGGNWFVINVQSITYKGETEDYKIATGIEGIETIDQKAEAIYNLSGQRVNAAKNGIFIVNGKKVVR